MQAFVTRLAIGLSLAALAGGCAGVRPQAAFSDVRADLAGRLPQRVVWATGSAEDAAARAAVDSLLADSLTAAAAVQVALLHNRRLQATYESLGVAQAALVQAGLLSNPVFGGRARWPLGASGPPDLGLSVAFDVLDVVARPLRRRVAASAYDAVRARVTGAVLDLAGRTHAAWIRAQADAARLALDQRVEASARAGYGASRLLREAGNVPAVDLLAEQARYEQARLDRLAAEGRLAESRERLARLMGVSGPDARFALAGALPPVPTLSPLPFVRTATEGGLATTVVDVAALEAAAVDASLDLAAARLDVETAARRLGVTDAERLLPSLDAGGEVERDDDEGKAGPDVEVTLPLFDQGQARRAALRADLRRAQALYTATAVDLRSAARLLAQRLATTRQTGLHYQTVVLPLRAELTSQTLRQYNAMQTGVFALLQAQQMEADAARRYVDALGDYWETRVALDLLLQGRMPDLDDDRERRPSPRDDAFGADH